MCLFFGRTRLANLRKTSNNSKKRLSPTKTREVTSRDSSRNENRRPRSRAISARADSQVSRSRQSASSDALHDYDLSPRRARSPTFVRTQLAKRKQTLSRVVSQESQKPRKRSLSRPGAGDHAVAERAGSGVESGAGARSGEAAGSVHRADARVPPLGVRVGNARSLRADAFPGFPELSSPSSESAEENPERSGRCFLRFWDFVDNKISCVFVSKGQRDVQKCFRYLGDTGFICPIQLLHEKSWLSIYYHSVVFQQ